MKRQLLVGHFGYDDSFAAVVGIDEQITYLQLIAGQQTFGLWDWSFTVQSEGYRNIPLRNGH